MKKHVEARDAKAIRNVLITFLHNIISSRTNWRDRNRKIGANMWGMYTCVILKQKYMLFYTFK